MLLLGFGLRLSTLHPADPSHRVLSTVRLDNSNIAGSQRATVLRLRIPLLLQNPVLDYRHVSSSGSQPEPGQVCLPPGKSFILILFMLSVSRGICCLKFNAVDGCSGQLRSRSRSRVSCYAPRTYHVLPLTAHHHDCGSELRVSLHDQISVLQERAPVPKSLRKPHGHYDRLIRG